MHMLKVVQSSFVGVFSLGNAAVRKEASDVVGRICECILVCECDCVCVHRGGHTEENNIKFPFILVPGFYLGATANQA